MTRSLALGNGALVAASAPVSADLLVESFSAVLEQYVRTDRVAGSHRLIPIITQQMRYLEQLDDTGGGCARTGLPLLRAHSWEATPGSAAGDGDLAGYCTPEFIRMEAANSWVQLGKPEAAVETLLKALPLWQIEDRRDLGRGLALLAVAQARTGQADRALEAARHASRDRLREALQPDPAAIAPAARGIDRFGRSRPGTGIAHYSPSHAACAALILRGKFAKK